MTSLPPRSVLVRTWFGGSEAWELLIRQVQTPSEEDFLAYVDFINNLAFEGMTVAELKSRQPNGPIVSFIADEITLTDAEHPILAVWVLPRRANDGRPEPEPFRVIPSELWGVENNINIANMDWEDFSGSVDHDGVFRGFEG
jgi:hypothetical protein